MAKKSNSSARLSFAQSSPSLWPWLGLAAVILILDQFTKVLVVGYYGLHDSTVVTSFFSVTRMHNTGAAFSFLAAAGGWQRWFFTAIGVGAALLLVWLLRSHAGQRLFSFALACILGGAVGNVLDRVMYGYVVDFLDFHWSWLSPMFYQGHFPAFNLADSAITVGATCLLLDELMRVRRGR